MLMPFNTARYNALQTRVTRRLAASQFGLSYTFSKSINYADQSDSGLTWHWVEMWNRNRALAGFDRTHNLQIYGITDLPFGRGKKLGDSGSGRRARRRLADQRHLQSDQRHSV